MRQKFQFLRYMCMYSTLGLIYFCTLILETTVETAAENITGILLCCPLLVLVEQWLINVEREEHQIFFIMSKITVIIMTFTRIIL